MDYEIALISKILESGSIEESLGVSEELFIGYRDVWKFIKEFYSNHSGRIPEESIKSRFPSFEVYTSDVSISYIIEQLRKRYIHNNITDSIREQISLLKNNDPIQALEEIKNLLLKIDTEALPIRDTNVVLNTSERIREYDSIFDSSGITGIPTPWECFNKATQGFHEKELIMLAGRAKTGKTWAELILAWYQWKLGHTPLIFSREMSTNQIIKRIDALHSRISHSRYRSGELTSEEYERFKHSLSEMESGVPFWVVEDDEGVVGVSGIASKIRKYKPSIVYIDGGYLLEDERKGKAAWERWSNICWDLKKLARRENIPIVVSHQFNLQGTGDTGNSTTLKYGDVEMWFDLIIGVFQTEDLRLNKEMLFKILSQREGNVIQWVTEWDLETMSFQEKPGMDDLGDSSVHMDDLIRY